MIFNKNINIAYMPEIDNQNKCKIILQYHNQELQSD
jgi:hypothetical protein